ncbi:uncharacterized protein LOC128559296 [Mercenaria mercenaria]|uniref:uncharacterized protein LOC128559296 n=1 Tax=Mercenaria mercenaria TaxID=6596 RepID=UPI00234F8131|nr:uncharacterized protein LOC128559296 [Mercenaria mercenaria]
METSKAFDSQISDDLQTKQNELEKSLKAERDRVSKLQQDINSLKSVSEDVTYLKSRSMRDNLLFFGFDECKTPQERNAENCTDLILDYCKETLKIPDAQAAIKIERAHRLGYRYDRNKTRPIVVKFNHYPDKVLVKQKAHEALQSFLSAKNASSNQTGASASPTRPKIRVSEKFPKIIQDRRKALIPILVKAKEGGKKAYLSYDKLYINTMYTVENVASAGYS